MHQMLNRLLEEVMDQNCQYCCDVYFNYIGNLIMSIFMIHIYVIIVNLIFSDNRRLIYDGIYGNLLDDKPDSYKSAQSLREVYNKREYDDGTTTVVFRCSPKTAKCLNGGFGPRITLKGKKAFCVCSCPRKLRGPQCTKPRR